MPVRHPQRRHTSAFYEAQNISQSSSTTQSTTSLSGLGSMLVMGLPVDIKIDDHSSTNAQVTSIALGSVLQSNQAIEVDVGRKATFNGSKLIAPDIIFNNANGSQPGELVLGISTNTAQTSHTERTETAGVYQDMQGSGQTVQTANATLLKGQVSWGDGIHITVETPQVKDTDSSSGQSKGLMGFAIADTANSLIENNPTASGYPSGNTSGKAAIPEQSSRASLAQSLATLPENMTGLEYLDQLKARKDVNWQAVELAHDRWSYHQEGLTPAGAALLSIAVASVTGGMGSELLGGTAATATSGATLMGSTALATAVNAGFSALASQAAVAMVNNQGDIGKTLEQLGKEESIKNLALTMATAGALDKLGGSMGWNQINAKSDFIDQLQKNLGNNIATDMINSALDGKPFNEESLQRSLTNALITSGMAYGANAIGDAYSGKDGIPPSLNDFTHKLAHAVLGCAGGAASQGSMQGCAPGAVGAVVGELTAEYAKDKNWSNEDALALAKTLSAVSGVLVGGGGSNAQAVNTAATTGGNAAQNNYLIHAQKLELAALQKKCASAQNCSSEDKLRIQELQELEKKEYYSGKTGQYTFSQIEAERAYTGLTDEQLSAQRKADQQIIDAKLNQQSAAARAKVWQDFQQYAQDMQAIEAQAAQDAQTLKNNSGMGAVVRGASAAVGQLVTSLADLPQAASAVKQFFDLGGTPNEFIGLVAQGSYEDFKTATLCSNDFECSKAWTGLVLAVIPADRALVGVTKVGSEVRTLTKVGEEATVVNATRKVEQVVGGANEVSVEVKTLTKTEQVLEDARLVDKAPLTGSDGIYSSKVARTELETTYGAENVTSTTVVNEPLQRVNSNAEKGVTVISNGSGKAVEVIYQDPMTGQTLRANIPYDNRGLPVFDDVAKYTTIIDKSVPYEQQFKQATLDLRDAINAGKVDAGQFTAAQLAKIQAGSPTIPDFTWHHNAQSAPNNMQLVPYDVHSQVTHIGQGTLSQGK